MKRTAFLPLRSVSIADSAKEQTGFPFDVPLIRSLGSLEFDAPVTFFVGENGSGKSTLLEALAVAARRVVVGGDDLEHDASLAPARSLAAHLRLSWRNQTRRGFFLRSEDFFRFVKRMQTTRAELESLETEFADRYTGYGRQLAVGAARGQKAALDRRYGQDLDANSHGESFLKLFGARLSPSGLYLLDEPETPLSPQRQLALLSMMKDACASGSQFIVATHSPILMAYPEACILSFDARPPERVAYRELEHVLFTKAFLNDPDAYLRHLGDGDAT